MAQNIAARAYQLRDERFDTTLLLATEAHRLATEVQPGKTPAGHVRDLVTAAYYNPASSPISMASNSPMNAVAFSHDGKLVATGDFDGKVGAMGCAEASREGEVPKSTFRFGEQCLRAIAFSADGRSWL